MGRRTCASRLPFTIIFLKKKPERQKRLVLEDVKKDSKTENYGHQGATGFDDVLTVDKRPQGGRYVDPETVPKGSG